VERPASRSAFGDVAGRSSAAVAPHGAHPSHAHELGGMRQLPEAEPPNVVALLRSVVRWRSLPLTHQPSAQDHRLFRRPCGHPTQMGRRARRVRTPSSSRSLRVSAQLRLVSLDDSTGQVPHFWVGTLVRPPMNEQAHGQTSQEHHRHRVSNSPGHLPQQAPAHRTRHLPRPRARPALPRMASSRLTTDGSIKRTSTDTALRSLSQPGQAACHRRRLRLTSCMQTAETVNGLCVMP
jgi:hypothetical protein